MVIMNSMIPVAINLKPSIMTSKIFSCIAILLFIATSWLAKAQMSTTPAIVWQKTIGGNGTDSLSAFTVDADYSFVMCGSSKSLVSGNKTGDTLGGYDFWVVKTDSSGTVLWDKTFGGAKMMSLPPSFPLRMADTS